MNEFYRGPRPDLTPEPKTPEELSVKSPEQEEVIDTPEQGDTVDSHEEALAELMHQMAEERSRMERDPGDYDTLPRTGMKGFESRLFSAQGVRDVSKVMAALSIFAALGGNELARGKDLEEGERTEESARIDMYEQIFDQAAVDLRESHNQEISPETLEGIATALETYSVDHMINLAAEKAQMDKSDVLANYHVSNVHIYTEDNVDAFARAVAREEGMSLETFKISEQQMKQVEDFATHRAGMNFEGMIYLNASMIEQIAADSHHSVQDIALDILAHEDKHGFEHGAFTQAGGGWDSVYEGLVEYTSNDSLMEAHDTHEDAFSAYTDGPYAAANLLSEALMDDSIIWRTIVTGNPEVLEDAFDEIYGEGVFRSTVVTELDLGKVSGAALEMPDGHSDSYRRMMPVVGLINAIGDHAPELIDRANARIPDGNSFIYQAQSEGVQMVALVNPYTETGFANGYVHVDTEGGDKEALLVSRLMGPENLTGSFKDSQDHYISDDLFVRMGDQGVQGALDDVVGDYGMLLTESE